MTVVSRYVSQKLSLQQLCQEAQINSFQLNGQKMILKSQPQIKKRKLT